MNYQAEWFIKRRMCNINKFLCRFISIQRLKEIESIFRFRTVVHINHPQKLNEKILWLAYNTDISEWGKLADKYAVREYVQQQGLSEILIPCYGVFNSADDINLDELPDSFIIKATHGCKMNFICQDKKTLNYEDLKEHINCWLKSKLGYLYLEPHYDMIKPRVICEKLIADPGDIKDYKFHCINGKVEFILVCSERTDGLCRNVYDREWNEMKDIIRSKFGKNCERPDMLEKMIEIAEKLSASFPHVRVDLYEVGGGNLLWRNDFYSCQWSTASL